MSIQDIIKKRVLLILVFLLVIPLTFSQTTDYSAYYIYERIPDSIWNVPLLHIGQDQYDKELITLIKFNEKYITLESAELRLRLYDSPQNNDLDVNVIAITNWPSTVSYNNQPTYGNILTSFRIKNSQREYTITMPLTNNVKGIALKAKEISAEKIITISDFVVNGVIAANECEENGGTCKFSCSENEYKYNYDCGWFKDCCKERTVTTNTIGTTTTIIFGINPDTNGDGCVSMMELSAYIELWQTQQVTMQDLINVVEWWQQGCGTTTTTTIPSTTTTSTIGSTTSTSTTTTVPTQFCVDSDGGRNYYVKGTTSRCPDNNATLIPCIAFVDNCVDNVLREGYCNKSDQVGTEEYVCQNICKDGACLNETQIPEAELTLSTLKDWYEVGEQINLTDPPTEKFSKEQSLRTNTINDPTTAIRKTSSPFKGYIVQFKEKPVLEKKIELEKKAKINDESLLKPVYKIMEVILPATLEPILKSNVEEKIKDYNMDVIKKLQDNKKEIAKTLAKNENQINVLSEFTDVFNGVALDISDEEAMKLKELNEVKEVYPNYEVYTTLMDSVPLIGADDVWLLDEDGNSCVVSGKECLTGEGTTIAVIDTGVDYTHSDLGGCFGEGCKVVGGWDFVNWDNDPMDDHGHGTHVSATAAGNGILKGVAPDANIMAYKVLNANGRGNWDDVISAIERSVDPNQDGNFSDHVNIISMSLGADCRGKYSTWCGPDDVPSQAIDNAVNSGIIAVIAAGNSGPNQHTIGTPGTARKAITVGASHKNDQISEFSSRGPVVWSQEILIKPDVSAPGVSICAAQWDSWLDSRHCLDTEHIAISGTSMATPHVAGAAALIKQSNPMLEPEQVKSILVSRAKDIGYGPNIQGSGRIDVLKSVFTETIIFPSSISFGIVDLGNSIWSSDEEITIENIGNTNKQYQISIEMLNTNGINFVYPSSVSVNSGSLESFIITLEVDNSIVNEGEYSGFIRIEHNSKIQRIPFYFIKKYLEVEANPMVSNGDVDFTVVSYVDLVLLEGTIIKPDNTTENILFNGDGKKWQTQYTITQEGEFMLNVVSHDTNDKINTGETTFIGDLTSPELYINYYVNSEGAITINLTSTENITGHFSLEEQISNDEHDSYDPTIGIDSEGTLHLIWTDYPFAVFYKKLIGDTWSETERIDDPTRYARWPEMVVKDDKLHIIYYQNEEASPGDEYYYLYYTIIDAISGEVILSPVKYSNIKRYFGDGPLFYDFVVDNYGNLHGIRSMYIKISPSGELLKLEARTGHSITSTKNNDLHIVRAHNTHYPYPDNIGTIQHLKYDNSADDWIIETLPGTYLGVMSARVTGDSNNNLFVVGMIVTNISDKIIIKKFEDGNWIDYSNYSISVGKNYYIAYLETEEHEKIIDLFFAGPPSEQGHNAPLNHIRFDSQLYEWSEVTKLNEEREYSSDPKMSVDLDGKVYFVWEGWEDLGLMMHPQIFFKKYINSPSTIIYQPDSTSEAITMREYGTNGIEWYGTFLPTQFGTHSIKVIAYDKAGNEAESNLNVDISTIPDHLPVGYITSTNPSQGIEPLEVSFSAFGYDPDGGEVSFEWNFGDGTNGSGQNINHVYESFGVYTATLTVKDDEQNIVEDSDEITVIRHAPLQVEIEAIPLSGEAPLTVNFSANISGGVSPINCFWDFESDGIIDNMNCSGSPSILIGEIEYVYENNGTYIANLTVTDQTASTASDTVTIQVGRPKSQILNNGTTSFSGYLFMELQKHNGNYWQPYQIIVEETTPRTVEGMSHLALDLIWNEYNVMVSEPGQYRVHAEFRDENGQPIQTTTGYLQNSWEFNVI